MNVTIIYQIRIFIHLTFTVPSDLDTKHDLDIVKMYIYTEDEVPRSSSSEVTTQGDLIRQTRLKTMPTYLR